jgi:C-terminal processing protease CtpA/Prc
MRIIKSVLFLFLFLFISPYSYGQTTYQKDFAYYWNTIKDNFAYFDSQKTDWDKVKHIYQPVADTISSNSSFIRFLETVNNELYNGHVSLNTNLASSNRLIPTGADIWVAYQQQHFVITAIRKGFNADLCGLKVGMRIIRYNGMPVDSAVQKFLPRSVATTDERMYAYAANMLLAGTRDSKRSITVMANGVEQTFSPDSIPNRTEAGYPSRLEHRLLASQIGYIKINNSLGDFALIKAFDQALEGLWETKGLIIDLRETPSGGNTTVARAIMSRFIATEMPYQKHSLPQEEKEFGVKRSWVELVSARGRTYKKPVVILVNRWTGSMGEGIAVGFDGMKRGQIVGEEMGGLLGAIYSFSLPETKIGFSIPAEKLFHVDGTPRERFVPRVLEPDTEKMLAKAVKMLRASQKSKGRY